MNRFLLPLFFLSLTAFGQTQPEMVWKTADDPVYMIQYPSNWTLDKSGQSGTSLILFSEVAPEEDPFRENVSVIVQDLTGYTIDLEKYVSISEAQIKSSIASAMILESSKMKIGNQDFHKILYSGYAGDLRLTFEQYYFMKDQKAYVVTFTTEQDTFNEFKETGEKILNSFRLK